MRVNEQIRIPRVLVIDENGQKLGVMDTRDAIRLARSKGLDLIEVAPHARPPVCRIMDYGKFKYQQRKKEKEARKHQKELKEIRLTPQMSEHDLLYRVKSAEEFLMEGHRVRVFMQIWGRWAAHTDLGEAKLQEFVNQLSHVATIETPLTHQGRLIAIVLAPRKDTKQKAAASTTKPVTPPSPQPVQPTQSTQQTQPQPETSKPVSEQTQPEPPKVIEVSSGEG
ncbi:MAG: translation initiation factor IF-3 [Armatimonadota bacterium]